MKYKHTFMKSLKFNFLHFEYGRNTKQNTEAIKLIKEHIRFLDGMSLILVFKIFQGSDK